MPGTYHELIKVARCPHCSTEEMTAVVERDSLVSAKILQLANSVSFGLDREIGSIFDAVQTPGAPGPHGHGGDLQRGDGVSARLPDGFHVATQKHALRCAVWARRLVPEGKFRDEVVTTALIHDLGRSCWPWSTPWSMEKS